MYKKLTGLGFFTASLAIATSGTQAATISTVGCATADACTLAELIAGGSLTIDDISFSNFAVVRSDAFGGATAFDPGAALLSGTGNAGTAGFEILFNPVLGLYSADQELAVELTFDAAVVGSAREMDGLWLAAGGFSRSGDASFEATAELLPLDGSGQAQIISDIFGTIVSDSDSFDAVTSASFSLDFGIAVYDDASVEVAGLEFRVALSGETQPAVIPLPAAAPMLLGALSALGFFARRRRWEL